MELHLSRAWAQQPNRLLFQLTARLHASPEEQELLEKCGMLRWAIGPNKERVEEFLHDDLRYERITIEDALKLQRSLIDAFNDLAGQLANTKAWIDQPEVRYTLPRGTHSQLAP